MNYYAFHIGDYAVATGHLEPMEDLAYRRLLDLYYVREAPLPDDAAAVAKLVRLRGEVETVRAMLVEFFQLTAAGWVHSRCDAEIEQAQSKRMKAKASAAKRWQCDGNADADPSHEGGNAPKTNPNPKTNPTEAVASEAAGKPARASRKCPASFIVTEEMREWAAEKAPGVNLEAETEKLRDHTFKNAATDWSGVWRNWMRRATDDLPRSKPPAATETAYQRSMRERMAGFAPGAVAKAPGQTTPAAAQLLTAAADGVMEISQ